MGGSEVWAYRHWKTRWCSSGSPVLSAIWEAEFKGFSYGSGRRSQHDALDALAVGIEQRPINWVLDADIRGYFDSISHEWLVRMIEYRVGDRRITALIQKWLRAGVHGRGEWSVAKRERRKEDWSVQCLRTSIFTTCSTSGLQQWRKREARGAMIIVRYADDFVVGFEHREEADRFRES